MRRTFPALVLLAALAAFGANAKAQLYVGSNSSGQTTNFTSGSYTYSSATVGNNTNDSNNTLFVANTNTLLSVSDRLIIGNSGPLNSLVISNGASVTSDTSLNDAYYAIVGSGSKSSNNSVLVTGAGSSWSDGYLIEIGSAGSGNSLTISNGGQVGMANAEGVEIGSSTHSSNNWALVTGAGSILNKLISVGSSGTNNSLTISNGGLVLSSNSTISSSPNSSSNTVLVTGSGSTWSNSGIATIASYGGATLTVANGGVVSAAGGILVASQSNSTGTLNIGSVGGSDTAGTISSPTITFGSGNASINFNQSDSSSVTSSISGLGGIKQLGSGTTILAASNSYTGTTLISQGTFLADNTSGSAVGTSSVLVTNAGTLGGNGSIGGTLTIGSGGELTPGLNGVGELRLTSGVTLQTGSITSFLINSTNNFTSLNILGGTVSYGGTLRLNLLNYASSASLGDTFALFSDWANGATHTQDFASVQALGDSFNFSDNGGLWTGTDTHGTTYEFSDATGNLIVLSVPESSSSALLGLGALAALLLLRKKQTS